MTGMALYTTMFSDGEQFWKPFLESLVSQIDGDYTLWIGVDGIEPEGIQALVQPYVSGAIEVIAGRGSPVAIRIHALRQVIEQHETVVLVDSDDVLLPDRVRAARTVLKAADVVGCAMELIDDSGRYLNRRFCPPLPDTAAARLPCVNVFGFSNTAYRCPTLRKCLPATAEAELLDWHVATKAWLFDAGVKFDPHSHMLYRQYSRNVAGVSGPYSVQRLRVDIPRVIRHYELLLDSDLTEAVPDRVVAVEQALASLVEYWNRVTDQPDLLEWHVRSLGFGDRVPMWWEWVTSPVFGWKNSA